MKTQMAGTKHRILAKLAMKNGQTTSHMSLAQAQQTDAKHIKRYRRHKKHKHQHQELALHSAASKHAKQMRADTP